MKWLIYAKALGALLLLAALYYLFFCAIFEFKLDYTKNHELILWYNNYSEEKEKLERDFIILFKFKNNKPTKGS